jgi:hypothetical protein
MTIEKLGARFEASAHKKHPTKGYTYVSIDLMIGRLNEVFGVDYSTEIIETKIGADFVMVQCRISYADSKGERHFKDGIGACPYPKKGMDIDDVCKTAYAEAIKKACNQLGIALYLWDEDERKEVEQEMRKPKPKDAPKGSPEDEIKKLMDATLAEIRRSNCPQELFEDWAKSKGYPTIRAKMNAEQLRDALDYLKALPNASKTA